MIATTTTRPTTAQLSRAFTLVATEVERTGVAIASIDAKSSSPYAPRGMVQVGIHVAARGIGGGDGEAGAAQIASLFDAPRLDDEGDYNAYWRGEWNLMGIFIEVYTGKDPEALPRDCEAGEW